MIIFLNNKFTLTMDVHTVPFMLIFVDNVVVVFRQMRELTAAEGRIYEFGDTLFIQSK